MRFYLSSYKLGDQPERFVNLTERRKIGYIPNAIDFSEADPNRVAKHISKDIDSLQQLGLEIKRIDLKDYFSRHGLLFDAIKNLDGLWVSGGNVFVLRQAMKLSGLDNLLTNNYLGNDFVYGGYSAGCCVLSPSLKPYQIVDDATDLPYPELTETIWDGLGLLDFAFMPHFDSDHPESSDIAKEIEYCQQNEISYRTFSDGEVLII